ncbi:MAG: sigma-54 interaction domain-containing protein [Eubacteriaceae bacterium]
MKENVFEIVLDMIYDGIVVVNAKGGIEMISEAYLKFLGYTSKEEVIGKHCTEIIENTRLHVVLETGIPEMTQLQKIKGSNMIASRIPIVKNGKIIGAVGKVDFRNVEDLGKLHKKILRMEEDLQGYKNELIRSNQAKYTINSIVGNSPAISDVKHLISKASMSDANVLITGESGTGKELVAHAIHQMGNRKEKPFVKINCGAIPNELLESELFGYETGAFTGAKKGGKIGKFQIANAGTIFLDEIGEMPLSMQVKLLRVLQEKEVETIGSKGPSKIDVRIIVATNKDLEREVEEKNFRSDLYYRVNVINIHMPPLRERKEDIKLLCDYFIDRHRKILGKNIQGLHPMTKKIFEGYFWKGNIRELENILERGINLMEPHELTITPEHLPNKMINHLSAHKVIPLREAVEKAERELIRECLIFTKGNKTKASELLKLNRTSLYEKIEKYEL